MNEARYINLQIHVQTNSIKKWKETHYRLFTSDIFRQFKIEQNK